MSVVRSTLLLGEVLLDELLHLADVDRRVLARAIGQLHGEPEDRYSAGDIVEPADHVALAGDRDDGLRAALADHAPGELAARCNEGGHVVAPGDIEDAVERRAGKTARDEDQQLVGRDGA